MFATDSNPLSQSGVAAFAASYACKIGTYYRFFILGGREDSVSKGTCHKDHI